jgi:hypothetical protein
MSGSSEKGGLDFKRRQANKKAGPEFLQAGLRERMF